jgi:type III restriction enzyme
VKGYERAVEDVKRAAALRWVAAVNADGKHGFWQYRVVKDVSEVGPALDAAVAVARS